MKMARLLKIILSKFFCVIFSLGLFILPHMSLGTRKRKQATLNRGLSDLLSQAARIRVLQVLLNIFSLHLLQLHKDIPSGF